MLRRVRLELADVRDAAVPRPDALCAQVATSRNTRVIAVVGLMVPLGLGVAVAIAVLPGLALAREIDGHEGVVARVLCIAAFGVPLAALLSRLIWRGTGRGSARQVALARDGTLSTAVVERVNQVRGQYGRILYAGHVGIDHGGRPAEVTFVVERPVADGETCAILHVPRYADAFVWCGDQPGVHGVIKPRS